MNYIDWKKFLPHLVAIAVFYLVTILYFSPLFFENKDLTQGDVLSYLGWGDDVRRHYNSTGEYCYWSNAMFGGMPSNYSFPAPTNNVFRYIQHVALGFLPLNTAGPFFAYMLGFYIFMLVLGCVPWLSALGAVGYALCSYNLIIIDAGHVSKALVMATIAPVLGGIILTYRKKYLAGIALTLIATGLNVYWNHQQITYYLLIAIICLAVAYLVNAVISHSLPDYFKSSAVLLVVALLAVAPAADKLIPTYDFSKETMRGGAVLKANPDGKKDSSGLDIDYAYQWSYGKAESLTLLMPNFMGASSHYNIGSDSHTYDALRPTGQAARIAKQAPMYWGNQPFTSGPVYIGAIFCFLFLFGLFVCKGPERWWMLAACIITFVLSWGRNLPAVNEWLFHHLPLYNKFRTPSMALVIPSVLMVALGVMALKKVLDTEDKRSLLVPLYISAGVTAGLCLLFALFGGAIFSFKGATDAQLPEWLHSALIADRKQMLSADAWRSFIFISLAFVVIFLYIRRPFNNNILFAVLSVLVIVDLWSVDKRFLNDGNFIPNRKAKTIEETAIDRAILQDKDPDYRVLNLASNTFNESMTSYRHKSIGGYSPAKLRRYQDLIDYHISRRITPSVINMLNTKYLIVNSSQGPSVQQNPDALGHAWFVDEIRWTASPDEEITALYDINPRRTALLENEWKSKFQNPDAVAGVDSSAVIELTDYRSPGNLFYRTSSSKAQLALFSEVFYKTWHVYIDGTEVPLLRANYILRAVEVPAGNHTIEFRCVDDVYETSHTVSLFASIVVVLVLLAAAAIDVMLCWKKSKLAVVKS